MSERPNPAQSPQDSDPPPDVNEAEEILKVAGKFTEEASKAARQMSLAGLAAIWLFNVSLTDSFSLPKGLTLPTLLFIMAPWPRLPLLGVWVSALAFGLPLLPRRVRVEVMGTKAPGYLPKNRPSGRR